MPSPPKASRTRQSNRVYHPPTPKTPPGRKSKHNASSPNSSRNSGMVDPETTPKRHRHRPTPYEHYTLSPSLGRRNSWEDLLPSIESLQDPRELPVSTLMVGAVWQGEPEAFRALKKGLRTAFFLTRPQDYRRMARAIASKDATGGADVNEIVRVASLLLAGHPDLADCLSECIPPGYVLKAADDCVHVTTPEGEWVQYPDGRRMNLYRIPPSH